MSADGAGRAPAIAGVRGSSFYKIVYFFPQVLSIAIVALLFQFAYNPRQRRDQPACGAIGLDSVQPAGWATRASRCGA